MKSKRHFSHAIVAVAIGLLGFQSAWGMDTAEVRKKFTELHPKVGAVIYSVRESGIDGIYELASKEGEVMYYAPATGHLIFGRIYDQDGKNIADETKNRLALERLQGFIDARDQAITVGSGPVEIIEITNPDCGYCRTLSKHLDGNPDVTRRIFMAVDTETVPKAKYVATSQDKEKALREVMSGQYDDDNAFMQRSYDDNGLIAAHRKLAEQAELESTPMLIINGTLVVGADLDAVDQLIAKAKSTRKPGN